MQWKVTALQAASFSGHLTAVSFLVLKAGADVNMECVDNHAALFYAARNGHLEIVKFLVVIGKANIERMSGPSNWTALAIACNNGQSKVVEFLVEKGAQVDADDTFLLKCAVN